MNKATIKGIIFEYDGGLKCHVPNKPVVIVMPSIDGSMFWVDDTYFHDGLQVNEFIPDKRWFKTKEIDGKIDGISYDKNGILDYIKEITGTKDKAEKKLDKIKKIVEE